MTVDKYKKWDEIVNPALERSRRKEKTDPFADEISRAIGLNEEKTETGEDIWSNKSDGADEEPQPAHEEKDPVSDRWEQEMVREIPERKSALERWNEAPDDAPEKVASENEPVMLENDESTPQIMNKGIQDRWEREGAPREEEQESALDRWSVEETPQENFEEEVVKERDAAPQEEMEEVKESALERWSEEPSHQNMITSEPEDESSIVHLPENYAYDGKGRWERESPPPQEEVPTPSRWGEEPESRSRWGEEPQTRSRWEEKQETRSRWDGEQETRSRWRQADDVSPTEPERDSPLDREHGVSPVAVEERESALDRWSTGEKKEAPESKFGYDVDMTESEREAHLDKRKKLKNVMDEFVSWKGSMD